MTSRGAPPDCYEWTDRYPTEIRLIDPEWCPAGHPFRFGMRKAPELCRPHGDHLAWVCACGQQIWRHDGAYVGQLPCISSPASAGSGAPRPPVAGPTP